MAKWTVDGGWWFGLIMVKLVTGYSIQSVVVHSGTGTGFWTNGAVTRVETEVPADWVEGLSCHLLKLEVAGYRIIHIRECLRDSFISSGREVRRGRLARRLIRQRFRNAGRCRPPWNQHTTNAGHGRNS